MAGCPAEDTSVPFDTKDINMSEYLNSARAENFIGRQWLYREMENVLENDDLSGVLILGNPGAGKTALSSQLICSRTTSPRIHSHILGYHLCKYSDKNTQMTGKFVRNLAEMIARRLPEYGYIVANSSYIQRSFDVDCIQNQDPVGCFEQAIISPLRNLKNKPREKWYIVLDALDECLSKGGDIGHNLVYLLNEKIPRFPSWLKLILTSRNESVFALHTSKLETLVINPEDSRNLEDIEFFVTTRLYQGGPLLNRIKSWFGDDSIDSTTQLIAALLSKSQGNFLFVKEMLIHWERSKHELRDAYALPKTLEDLYQSYFERRFPNSGGSFKSVRRVLELLVATVEPVTQNEIFKVLRMKEMDLDEEYEFRNRLEELGHFLTYGEDDAIALYHLSLNEWLTSGSNKRFYVSKRRGHEIFCHYYFSLIRHGDKRMLSRYILSLAQHIAYGGWKEAYVREFLNFPSQTVNSSDPHSNRTLLHLAATINSTDVLELLLRHFTYIDSVDNLGMTPAFLAAQNGLVNNLAVLVKRGADVNRKTPSVIAAHLVKIRAAKQEGRSFFPYIERPVYQSKSQFLNATMLHAAAQEGHINVIRFLLHNNISIHSVNDANLSAIQLAAENGHAEIVKALYEAGAVVDQTALHHAAENNRLKVVELLLRIGVRDECLRCDGSFYWLKRFRHRFQPSYSRMKESGTFFENMIDWEATYSNNANNNNELFDDKHLIYCHSALHAAVASGHYKVVSRLLSEEHNALHCHDYTGRTPLHEAIRKNDTKIVKLLLEKEPTMIHKKCEHWQDVYKWMLSVAELNEYHADVCHCGYTPLHLAARYGHHELGMLLITEGARVDDRDCRGATPFHVAACHNKGKFVSIFSHPNVGGDINSNTVNGSTPLHSAAVCGAVEVIAYLRHFKANFTAVDENGLTALHYSIFYLKSSPLGQKVVLNNSWSYGAIEVHEIDHMGGAWVAYTNFTPIEDGNPYQNLEIMMSLVAKSLLDIDAVDSNGQTPLHTAAQNGLAYTVLFLLERNATMEKKDNQGKTPLELAVEGAPQLSGSIYSASYFKVVQFLLSNGASSTKCNRSGSSLLHRAIVNQQPRIIQLLLTNGANLTCKDNLGRTPLVSYLHNGGDWIDVVMNAFTTSVDIKCGEPFNSSVFHLLSYRSPTVANDNFFHSGTCKFYNRAECNAKKGTLAEAIENQPRKQELVSSCLDAEGFTPLHRAAQGGNVVAIRYLLENGANDSVLSPNGHDALTLSILYAVGTLGLLYGDVYDNEQALRIHQATEAAFVLLHHAMKSRGYRVTCNSSNPELTLYHLAAARGLVRFVGVLLGEKEFHQLDVNCPNKDGITPMYLANIFAKRVGLRDGFYNPWEDVVDIIEDHGGELRYPRKDAEYNVIYNRLHGWNLEEFSLDLKPSIRLFISSRLAFHEKDENNSFLCSVKNYDYGINLMPPLEMIWVEIGELITRMKRNFNQFLARDINRCFEKHLSLKLDDYYPRSSLRRQAYEENVPNAGKWESYQTKQKEWFEEKILFLSRRQRKETLRGFDCVKSLYFRYKTFLYTKKLDSLIREYKKRSSSYFLDSICQDLKLLFKDYLEYQKQRTGMPSEFNLHRERYRLPDFLGKRMALLSKRRSDDRLLLMFGFRSEDMDWPLKLLLRRSLGLYQRYSYLKILQVGIHQSTHVPLLKYTEKMRQILERIQ